VFHSIAVTLLLILLLDGLQAWLRNACDSLPGEVLAREGEVGVSSVQVPDDQAARPAAAVQQSPDVWWI
jgi:hypothetical protein